VDLKWLRKEAKALFLLTKLEDQECQEAPKLVAEDSTKVEEVVIKNVNIMKPSRSSSKMNEFQFAATQIIGFIFFWNTSLVT